MCNICAVGTDRKATRSQITKFCFLLMTIKIICMLSNSISTVVLLQASIHCLLSTVYSLDAWCGHSYGCPHVCNSGSWESWIVGHCVVTLNLSNGFLPERCSTKGYPETGEKGQVDGAQGFVDRGIWDAEKERICIGWGWWQKHLLKFYGVLSLLEADPLELWVLKWKRQLRIMTQNRRHIESSICAETSYSNKHFLRAMATMHVKIVSVMNVCACINIDDDGWHGILQTTDGERSLSWRALWGLNMMKRSRSDRSRSTCLVYVCLSSSGMFVSSADIFLLLVCISWVALAQVT